MKSAAAWPETSKQPTKPARGRARRANLAGIGVRTLQRWKSRDGLTAGGGRSDAARPTPVNAPTLAERQRILRVADEPRFAEMPLAPIVPALADRGVFIASESSSERVLRERARSCYRGRAKAQRPSRPPTTHVASAPRQLWY